jgi:hypothetical protein
MLTLPIWIVTEHIKPTDPDHTPEKKSGRLAAFTSSEKLLKFVKANLGGEWKMEMADDRDGLVVLIADLHRIEVETLTLDPKNDGSGGKQITLSNLIDFADSLREGEQEHPQS